MEEKQEIRIGIQPEAEATVEPKTPVPAAQPSRGIDSLGSYNEWRKPKCPPYETSEPWQCAVHPLLELVGEVAESTELFMRDGIASLLDSDKKLDLIDELGDVVFCATWVLDALCDEHLEKSGLMVITDDEARNCELVGIGITSRVRELQNAENPELTSQILRDQFLRAVWPFYCGMSTAAGLAANVIKKAVYHGKAKAPNEVCGLMYQVIGMAEHILSLHGVSLRSAIAVNVSKINRKFPDGYKR